MKPPEGHQYYKKCIQKLKKAIYGLKQSGREWNLQLDKFILKIGFKRLTSESYLHIKRNNQNTITCILGVYVDDILITGKNKEIQNTKKKNKIKKRFNKKEIGNVDFVIGIKFIKC